ncbi:hypothetical protein VaNZ11_008273, partial [Volvox africanus]
MSATEIMSPPRNSSWEPRAPLPTSERTPENSAWPSTDGELLTLLETHGDLLVRVAAGSATEGLQHDLTATVLKLQVAQLAAMAQVHEIFQGLQREISDFQSEATAQSVAEHRLQMQAVVELARQHAQLSTCT